MCDIPTAFGECFARRELYLGRQMELEHVLGRVSHARNPVHTPGALPTTRNDAQANTPWDIPKYTKNTLATPNLKTTAFK